MVRPQDIRALLTKNDWTQSQLAEAAGVTQGTVSRWLKGAKMEVDSLRSVEKLMAAASLDYVDGSELIPVVGKVGAGGSIQRIQSTAQGVIDQAPTFPGATDSTVAVEIEGESLGALFDQWLVYYDEVFDPPTSNMLNRLCVCGLADGRVLIKKLTRSRDMDGAFTLLSNYEPPIYDVFLDWAALVNHMAPR